MTHTKPDQEFRAHLAAGRFMIQRSASSGAHVFYPRVAEPGTGRQDLEWVEASGGGEIYALTIVHPRPPEAPYNVAIIALDEGPRLMSRIEDVAPDALKIGQRVISRIADLHGTPNVVFDLA
ncbi:OB-fold domain-containing protein [uncultured Brevundimonas sp.]|uniref:Zn-ribbon domain-containing OB-fold protein n=1 Tax=uncultured Brevundimonas sp. TaxID=213418 RepID=UPI0025F7C49A|nr:OB-fold domain-containing protein [uncultured Brevundimonas sp.]